MLTIFSTDQSAIRNLLVIFQIIVSITDFTWLMFLQHYLFQPALISKRNIFHGKDGIFRLRIRVSTTLSLYGIMQIQPFK